MSSVPTVAGFDREKVELIKQTVAKGATDLELQLFFHACQRTGLDPLMKQIYAIKRWSSVDRREVMSFQCGIDGYRLIADRTGKYAGSSDAIYEEEAGKPFSAQVTVLKLVNGEKCAFTASARWSEYVQSTKDGQATSMWKKMPYLMLAKCAEALALRKAFPAELSGVYTHEEMMQADNTLGGIEAKRHSGHEKVNEIALEQIRQKDGADLRADSGSTSAESDHQQASDAPAPVGYPSAISMMDIHDLFAIVQSEEEIIKVANRGMDLAKNAKDRKQVIQWKEQAQARLNENQ